ncbi:MAG: hypothetical protein V1820_02360 [archaeon]
MPYYFKLGAKGPVAASDWAHKDHVSAALREAGYFQFAENPDEMIGSEAVLVGEIVKALASHRHENPKQSQTYQINMEAFGRVHGYRLNVARENVFLNQ